MSERIEQDSKTVPTKELLRRNRKQAYEAQKAAAKRERKSQQEQQLAAMKEAQSSRDRELWLSLASGSDLEEKEPPKERTKEI